MPLSSGDIEYFNGLEEQLNTVIQNAAKANNATFVNTFTSSIGHDACKSPGTAWVNGFIPTSPGYPLHPNQAGEQNMATRCWPCRTCSDDPRPQSETPMAPDLTDLAVSSVRTLRAFGKRIPGAGGVLAESLDGAVEGAPS